MYSLWILRKKRYNTSMKNLPLNYQFIPSKIPSKKLMIVLHGRGDSSDGFKWMPNALQIDTMNYILLDAPYDYFGGRSWYDLPPHQLIGIEHSKKLLTQTLDILFEEKFNVKESFLFGFSQGSLLTFEFGARYHKVLAGYLAISGYIYDTSKILAELNPNIKNAPWLCTHGTYDDVLAYATSKEQVETLQKGGFEIEFKSYPKAHTIAQDELTMIEKWIKSKI